MNDDQRQQQESELRDKLNAADIFLKQEADRRLRDPVFLFGDLRCGDHFIPMTDEGYLVDNHIRVMKSGTEFRYSSPFMDCPEYKTLPQSTRVRLFDGDGNETSRLTRNTNS